MSGRIQLLGIAGSLRKGSYNHGLLRAAKEEARDCDFEIFDLSPIPLFNEDLEAKLPSSVSDLKAKLRSADGIIIATPEYNYSIPGVLKNAIDWASRPYGESAWDQKPVALMGASPAIQGTSRSQYHLRQVFVTLNMRPLNRPELMIGEAFNKFDEEGNLTDLKIREKLREFIQEFTRFIKKD